MCSLCVYNMYVVNNTVMIHALHSSFKHRSVRTQLLLWPSRPLSSPACLHSPILSRLVFTRHTGIAYAHTTQRVFPLKTSASTSAELTKISSTVSDHSKQNDKNDVLVTTNGHLNNGSENYKEKGSYESMCVESGRTDERNMMNHSNMAAGCNGGGRRSVECHPCGEYHCVYTDLPKFLVTYSPKVRVYVCVYIQH